MSVVGRGVILSRHYLCTNQTARNPKNVHNPTFHIRLRLDQRPVLRNPTEIPYTRFFDQKPGTLAPQATTGQYPATRDESCQLRIRDQKKSDPRNRTGATFKPPNASGMAGIVRVIPKLVRTRSWGPKRRLPGPFGPSGAPWGPLGPHHTPRVVPQRKRGNLPY